MFWGWGLERVRGVGIRGLIEVLGTISGEAVRGRCEGLAGFSDGLYGVV